MSTPPNLFSLPYARIELLSLQLKRSLLISLNPYAAGLELTATLWVSGHALIKASAYIAEVKGLRLHQNSRSMQEDYGDYSLVIGRTTFSIMADELDRLLTFLAAQNIAVEITKL